VAIATVHHVPVDICFTTRRTITIFEAVVTTGFTNRHAGVTIASRFGVREIARRARPVRIGFAAVVHVLGFTLHETEDGTFHLVLVACKLFYFAVAVKVLCLFLVTAIANSTAHEQDSDRFSTTPW
jgi:hypothetical protein